MGQEEGRLVVRVRTSRPTENVTAATVDSGPGEPQTTVTFRVWDGGCDLVVFFTPYPNQSRRTHDRSEPKRLA